MLWARDMDVVCFGQQNWDYCWTGKQQLMTRLAQRGHRVLYVDPQSMEDVAGLHDVMRSLAPVATAFGVRELAPRLFVYTHRHAPPLRWRVNHWLRPHRLAALAERLAFRGGVAIAHHPSAEPLLGMVRPRARIYYAVDEATAFGAMPVEERQRIRAAEERMARDADIVLAISPRLHTRLSALQPRTYLLESAADVDHFAPARLARAAAHPAVASIPSPRLGFVGQIDERIDQALLVALARARPDWHIVLAGRVKHGVDVSALTTRPNIHLLGHQPYELLPSVLRDIDVCIAPYRLTPLTQACSPLKVYEYLATGRPVIATPVNALLRLGGVVTLADAPDAFRAAVTAALANPAAGRERRLAFAEANSWDARVDELEHRFEEALARHPGRPRLVRPSQSAARWRAWRPRQPRSSETRAPIAALDAEALSLRARVPFLVLCGAGWLYYGARVGVRLLRGRRPAGIRRILVARRTRLGDLVVLLPTLRALRERYPHARIVLGVQRGMSAGAVLAGSADIDEVRELDHLDRSSRLAQLAGTIKLFADGFDLVISGARYFLLREAFLSGAPRRVGLDDGHPLQRLNTRVLPFDVTRHEADNNLALVEALSGPVEGAARIPSVPMHDAAAAGLARLTERLALPADAPVLTVHPGSQKPSHRWPAERFAELVCRLLTARPALHVVFSGVADEAPLIDAIRGSLPEELRERAHSGIGLADIPTLIGLLHRSDACVSNDTGAMHLARACGTPVVALLGAEEDRRWGPY
ncbi:MAG TPA: glycosyltransferase family 9 protein, partial [Gemmatimonadaceae bacterium]